jgi:hypothetical protein
MMMMMMWGCHRTVWLPRCCTPVNAHAGLGRVELKPSRGGAMLITGAACEQVQGGVC